VYELKLTFAIILGAVAVATIARSCIGLWDTHKKIRELRARGEE